LRTNPDRDRLLRGANSGTASNPNPEAKRRELIVLAALIEHPQAGLLLFETGCAEDDTRIDIMLQNEAASDLPITKPPMVHSTRNMAMFTAPAWSAPPGMAIGVAMSSVFFLPRLSQAQLLKRASRKPPSKKQPLMQPTMRLVYA
jgi:hypothetical protein